jgi:hypothetical protein
LSYFICVNRSLAYYAVIGCTACSHEIITRYPETSLSFWNGGYEEDARCVMDSTHETHHIATLSRERCFTIFSQGDPNSRIETVSTRIHRAYTSSAAEYHVAGRAPEGELAFPQ